MCQIIVINRGKKEITTPRQFEKYFGFLPKVDEFYEKLELDYCLCQCDLEETFKSKNIKYWFDRIDSYFIGELDKLDRT